jgi:hypothetical protein
MDTLFIMCTGLTFTIDKKYENLKITQEDFLEEIVTFIKRHIPKITYYFVSVELNKRKIPHCHVLVNHGEEIDISRLRSEYPYSNFIYCQNVSYEIHYLNYISKYGRGYVQEKGIRGSIPMMLGQYLNEDCFDTF